jgi:hypothetical protein
MRKDGPRNVQAGSAQKFSPESGTQHTLKKQGKTALGQVPRVPPRHYLGY